MSGNRFIVNVTCVEYPLRAIEVVKRLKPHVAAFRASPALFLGAVGELVKQNREPEKQIGYFIQLQQLMAAIHPAFFCNAMISDRLLCRQDMKHITRLFPSMVTVHPSVGKYGIHRIYTRSGGAKLLLGIDASTYGGREDLLAGAPLSEENIYEAACSPHLAGVVCELQVAKSLRARGYAGIVVCHAPNACVKDEDLREIAKNLASHEADMIILPGDMAEWTTGIEQIAAELHRAAG